MSLVSALRTKLAARRGFAYSVGTLAGGTAFAQALTVLASPILTRLYTPDEYGVLAVYVSLMAILSVVAGLRLEIAIPIAAQDQEGASLLALALFSSTCFAAAATAIVFLIPDWVSGHLGVPAIKPYVWLIPLGLWLSSTYTAFQYWTTRKRQFAPIARTRLTQAFWGTGTQLAAGFMGAGSFGLLLGQLITGGAGQVGLARAAWREDRHLFDAVTWSSMINTLRKYSKFPKFSVPDSLANNIGSHAPVIIIAAFAAGPEVGYLALATRVIAVPMKLVGTAVSQVYLARASDEYRKGNLEKFTTQVLGGLFKTGVGPLLCIGIVATSIFPIVFGAEWLEAGKLTAWLIPWFVLQFISSPVSMVVHVTGNQRTMLGLTLAGIPIRVGAVIAAGYFDSNFLLEAYAIGSTVFYAICAIVFYRLAGVSLAAVTRTFISNTPIIASWALFGTVLVITLSAW